MHLWWNAQHHFAAGRLVRRSSGGGAVLEVRVDGVVKIQRQIRNRPALEGNAVLNSQHLGVRVIYFNRLANGEVWLLFMYAKAKLNSIAAEVLREMKDEIEKTLD